MEAGLILAGADEACIHLGREYGYHFGLAFQMTDDLLDVTGDAATLGKNVGMDAREEKMTWVALRGLEGTKQDARRESDLACGALNRLEHMDTAFFGDLVQSLLDRTY